MLIKYFLKLKIAKKIRYVLGNYRFQREVEKVKFKRQATGFDEAHKIGLLYDATDEQDYEVIKSYVKSIRNERKDVLALGYVDKRELPKNQFAQYGLDFFTRKNLNWHLIPCNPIVTNFINEPFDILINLSSNSCFPLRYIAATSHARFRVGRFDKKSTFCYDLMINAKSNTSIQDFLKLADNYIRIIKSKHGSTTI